MSRRRDDVFSTSVRVVGQQNVDDFHALCLLLGVRPYALAWKLVHQGLEAARQDPKTGPVMRELVANARAYSHRDGETGEPLAKVVPIDRGRRR